jgi:FkbM family methyltransferase
VCVCGGIWTVCVSGMSGRAWGGQEHEKSCRSPQALRRCLRRPRIALPFLVVLVIFLATNSTVGRLWRGVHSCASQKWAALNDGQYELGESIHTLESLGFEPQSVLDIGANEGNWVTAMKTKLPEASFFCVEGNEALEKILKPRVEALGVPYRIAIVGDTEKDVVFNVMCDGGPCSGGSSVFQENTRYGEGERTETRHMTTIDKLVDAAGVGPFQMIKLDIQGAEVIALQGATEVLKSVQVIVLETSNVEYNKGAPETLEVLNFMDSIGFKVFDITETHRKPVRAGEDSHSCAAQHCSSCTGIHSH